MQESALGLQGSHRVLSPCAGEALSAAQLANQVRLRARAAIARYYDGALTSDDELAPGTTRDICLRTQARSPPGAGLGTMC